MKRVAALAVSLVVRGIDLAAGIARRAAAQPDPCRGVVLYYHAVKADQRSRFARQMDVIAAHARTFSAATPEVMTGSGNHVAITFDDGFLSVVEHAVPELTSRGIPFTVFVPSGCLGSRPSWVRDPAHPSWEERVLSAAETRALAATPLATVGSHTVTHRVLGRLERVEAEEELVRSKADLQAAIGDTVDLFSFPHGGHTEVLLELARRAGYRRVFSIEPSWVLPDPSAFCLGRVAADPADWSIEFRLKLAGAYRWRHYLHRLREVM